MNVRELNNFHKNTCSICNQQKDYREFRMHGLSCWGNYRNFLQSIDSYQGFQSMCFSCRKKIQAKNALNNFAIKTMSELGINDNTNHLIKDIITDEYIELKTMLLLVRDQLDIYSK